MRPYFYRRYKLAKFLCGSVIGFFLLEYFGVFVHLFEKDFYKEFHYPYDGDIQASVEALRRHEKPEIPPINFYNYSFVSNCEKKCKDSMQNFMQPRLVYLVKSALDHFDRRLAIRKSWGYENRFSDVVIKTVFILGARADSELQERIVKESQRYRDIIQADFQDRYFNNTIKTMIAFKWAVNYCPLSTFYMFVDDDMYVSTKNVLRYVRNPTHYPEYLLEPIFVLQRQNRIKREIFINKFNHIGVNFSKHMPIHSAKNTNSLRTVNLIEFVNEVNESNYLTKPNNCSRTMDEDIRNEVSDINKLESKTEHLRKDVNNCSIAENQATNGVRSKRQVFDFELPSDVRLFTGYTFLSSPQRHKSSKWYITLDEYPYNKWPPYVTAGAFILSKEALFDMYYTSFYTKHFRFDDIYLGLLARKAGIEPYHCKEFYFYKKQYTVFSYHFVVASHGFDDTNELLRVWNEQKSAGNA